MILKQIDGVADSDFKELKEFFFENGAAIKLVCNHDKCYFELYQTFKQKKQEHLCTFEIGFNEKREEKARSQILENENIRFTIDYFQDGSDFTKEGESFDEIIENMLNGDNGSSIIYYGKVFIFQEDKRLLKIVITHPSKAGGIEEYAYGEIKLLKSLAFGQGKSVQEGKNSDAFINKALNIPIATLGRWKKTKPGNWRRKLYELLKEHDFKDEI